MESSKMDNVPHHAQLDSPTLMDHANNAQKLVLNVQEKPQLVLHVNQDSC